MPDAQGVPESDIEIARRTGVTKVNIDTDLRIALTAPPVDGEANAALLAFLGARGLPSSRGARSGRAPSQAPVGLLDGEGDVVNHGVVAPVRRQQALLRLFDL